MRQVGRLIIDIADKIRQIAVSEHPSDRHTLAGMIPVVVDDALHEIASGILALPHIAVTNLLELLRGECVEKRISDLGDCPPCPPQTGLRQAIASMILVGIGLGSFFSLSVIAQNVVPASRLGVSTARYLGQVGATLDIAIVGTVVSSSIAGNLLHRLPTTTLERGVLAGALQHGFVAMLVFALLALAAAFFLKDVPFVSSTSRPISTEEPAATSGRAEEELAGQREG